MRRVLVLLSWMLLAAICSCGPTTGPTATPTGSPSDSPSATAVVGGGLVGNSTCSPGGSAAVDPHPEPYSPSPPRTHGPPVGQAIAEMPHDHVQPPAKVTYLHDPPTSGCHYNLGYGTAPVQTGVYDQVIRPEYWVHNLEHGYVVVLYNCPSGCADDVKTLSDWYASVPPDPRGVGYQKILVMPETTMAPKFAAISWDWYDPMPTKLDINEVRRFYANHVDESPEEAGGTGVTP